MQWLPTLGSSSKKTRHQCDVISSEGVEVILIVTIRMSVIQTIYFLSWIRTDSRLSPNSITLAHWLSYLLSKIGRNGWSSRKRQLDITCNLFFLCHIPWWAIANDMPLITIAIIDHYSAFGADFVFASIFILAFTHGWIFIKKGEIKRE